MDQLGNCFLQEWHLDLAPAAQRYQQSLVLYGQNVKYHRWLLSLFLRLGGILQESCCSLPTTEVLPCSHANKHNVSAFVLIYSIERGSSLHLTWILDVQAKFILNFILFFNSTLLNLNLGDLIFIELGTSVCITFCK